MDEQAKRIREALLAERRAQITAQRAQRHESTCERQAELSAKQAQRREEITKEQLRRAALLKERQLSRQLAREAAKAARKERLIIIFKKPNNHQQ